MTMSEAIVRNLDEGERKWFLGGGLHTWKATAEETGGSMVMLEDQLGGGKVTPLHMHEQVDEAMYVIEGEILLSTGNGDDTILHAGGFAFAPRGCAHAFMVVSDTARLLAIQTPGSAEA